MVGHIEICITPAAVLIRMTGLATLATTSNFQADFVCFSILSSRLDAHHFPSWVSQACSSVAVRLTSLSD